MTTRIVCIGEPLAEISTVGGSFGVGFAGDTLNTAIYCARAAGGQDIELQYVCAVGEDALSDAAVALMNRENVGTDFITRDPSRQIGIYAIQNDVNGERSFHYWRKDSAARHMFATDICPELTAIKNADIVYLSGITLAIISPAARDRLWRALHDARATGVRVAFDSNYRPKLWESADVARTEISRYWEITDIALPTSDDEATLFGDVDHTTIIARIAQGNTVIGALKCGQEGPIPIPSTPTNANFAAAEIVVDTTGAGDSFNGAYLAAIAFGASNADALQAAHELARLAVGHKGAIINRKTKPAPKRVGSVIGLRPENRDEYAKLHADVWPSVLARLKASNFRNYSIYLKEPEMLMFGYFEYSGDDFEADNAAIANDPITQDWWKVCGPMQVPFESRNEGEWWAEMHEVFHLD